MPQTFHTQVERSRPATARGPYIFGAHHPIWRPARLQAHRLRGWRTLVLPLAAIAVAALAATLLGFLVTGSEFSQRGSPREIGTQY